MKNKQHNSTLLQIFPLLFTFALIIANCSLLIASVPRFITYQGKVSDLDGVGLNDTVAITFTIYDDSTGGTNLWEEAHSNIVISKGLFDVILGSLTPLYLAFDIPYWLEIEVDGDILTPRTMLTSSPYAFRAAVSDSLVGLTIPVENDTFIAYWDSLRGIPEEIPDTDWVIDGTNIYSGVSGNVGIGLTNPDQKFEVVGSGSFTGMLSTGFMRVAPNHPDTISPQAGDIRTTTHDGKLNVYIHDGTCWRKWFPEIDTTACFGLEFTVDVGNDTTVCRDENVELTAVSAGGWPPYTYDWNNDGTGDWDDNQTINVADCDTASYIVYAKDVLNNVRADTININHMSCFSRLVGDSSNEHGNAAIQTPGGGYIFAGYTSSSSALLCKVNNNGEFQWAKTISTVQEADKLIYTSDDKIVVIASYTVPPWDCGVLVMKFDSLGSMIWSTAVGGDSADYGYDLVEAHDGGIVVVGKSRSFSGSYKNDIFLFKLNATGGLVWTRTLGRQDDVDEGAAIIRTPDNGFIITGQTYYYGINDRSWLLAKYTSDGTLSWARCLDLLGYDQGQCLVNTADGGFAVGGITNAPGSRRMVVIKYSAADSPVWASGIQFNLPMWFLTYTSGIRFIFGGGNDISLAKFDNDGTLEWSKFLDTENADMPKTVIRSPDGGFALAGYTTNFGAALSDIFIIKFTENGSNCLPFTESLGSSTVSVTEYTITDMRPQSVTPYVSYLGVLPVTSIVLPSTSICD